MCGSRLGATIEQAPDFTLYIWTAYWLAEAIVRATFNRCCWGLARGSNQQDFQGLDRGSVFHNMADFRDPRASQVCIQDDQVGFEHR